MQGADRRSRRAPPSWSARPASAKPPSSTSWYLPPPPTNRAGRGACSRISPAEFLAGTVYLGEWETRVRNLVQAVRQPRRAVLYVPNLEELATMGMSSKSDANVATALAPHIERGEIAILGESTLESFRKGLGAVRSLRRLFHAVQLPPADRGGDADHPASRRPSRPALDVPSRSSTGSWNWPTSTPPAPSSRAAPSACCAVCSVYAAERRGPISERDILATISSSTGIPVDFLDDHVPLDRAEVRSLLRVARHGPARGGRCGRRSGHAGQGRPERSAQAVRRAPVRRPDRRRQDRAGPRPGRAAVRRPGPPGPPRHERVRHLRGLRAAHRPCGGAGLADGDGARAAVLACCCSTRSRRRI